MSKKIVTATELQKGSYVMIDGAPCKVSDLAVSRPGKHGHAKLRVSAVGLLDEKKRVVVMPGHDKVEVPIVDKRTAQVLSITGTTANVMDSETYEIFDIEIPPELKARVAEGSNILFWKILDQRIMKQLK